MTAIELFYAGFIVIIVLLFLIDNEEAKIENAIHDVKINTRLAEIEIKNLKRKVQAINELQAKQSLLLHEVKDNVKPKPNKRP